MRKKREALHPPGDAENKYEHSLQQFYLQHLPIFDYFLGLTERFFPGEARIYSNSQHNSRERSGTPADESQAAGCSHLQCRLIEESDELSREENHHLLSEELCRRQIEIPRTRQEWEWGFFFF